MKCLFMFKTFIFSISALSCSDQSGVAWVWSDPNVEGVQDPKKCTCKNSTIVHDEFVDTPWGVFGPTYPIIGLDISNQPPFGSDIPGGDKDTYQECGEQVSDIEQKM